MELLDQLKNYGKIEYEDDAMLETLIDAAKTTLYLAGVCEDKIIESAKPLYNLAVCRLALFYNENREEISDGKGAVPMGLNWMIEQLRNICRG